MIGVMLICPLLVRLIGPLSSADEFCSLFQRSAHLQIIGPDQVGGISEIPGNPHCGPDAPAVDFMVSREGEVAGDEFDPFPFGQFDIGIDPALAHGLFSDEQSVCLLAEGSCHEFAGPFRPFIDQDHQGKGGEGSIR